MLLQKFVHISNFYYKKQAILSCLAEGPVVLIRKGWTVAFMLNPKAYNQLLADLENYQEICAIDEAVQEQGDDPFMPLEDFIAEMKGFA